MQGMEIRLDRPVLRWAGSTVQSNKYPKSQNVNLPTPLSSSHPLPHFNLSYSNYSYLKFITYL